MSRDKKRIEKKRSREEETPTLTDDLRLAILACKQILGQLQTLSDKSASQMRTDGQLVHGMRSDGLRTRDSHALGVKSNRYADSTLPSGLDSRSGDHAPSKQISLFFHYRWRMQKAIDAENVLQLWGLVREATEDYQDFTGRPARRFETDKEAVAYLLTHLVGVSADRAAVEMQVANQSFRSALKWVRDNRARNGKDPENGEARELSPRAQRIFSLARSGLRQQDIADEMGISRQRVSQILATGG